MSTYYLLGTCFLEVKGSGFILVIYSGIANVMPNSIFQSNTNVKVGRGAICASL